MHFHAFPSRGGGVGKHGHFDVHGYWGNLVRELGEEGREA